MSMFPEAQETKRDKIRNNRIARCGQALAQTAVVEYRYQMLEMEHGAWYFALGRFMDQVKIIIVKAPGFEYEFQSIGGFPDLQPSPDILSFETIESEGGHLPGQGYLVQWYPADKK